MENKKLQTVVYTNYSLEDFIKTMEWMQERYHMNLGISYITSILKTLSVSDGKIITKNDYDYIEKILIAYGKLPDEEIEDLKE